MEISSWLVATERTLTSRIMSSMVINVVLSGGGLCVQPDVVCEGDSLGSVCAPHPAKASQLRIAFGSQPRFWTHQVLYQCPPTLLVKGTDLVVEDFDVTVALGHLRAIGIEQQRQVRKVWRFDPETSVQV